MDTTGSFTKCKCQHCSIDIEFEQSQAGSLVTCPNCGMETKLYIPQKPNSRPQPKSIAIKPEDRPVKKHLRMIRENSCYQELRGLINIVFFLCMMGVAVCVLFAWMLVIDVDSGWSVMKAVCVTGLCIIISGLLVALRQSFLLLIDIADTLLHEHSK